MRIRDSFSIIIASMVITSSIISFFPLDGVNIAGEPADVISNLSGSNVDDNFGWNVSDAGDVNGDGIEDIIVGAPGYNSDTGRAYIFFGGPWLTGDLSADNANVTLNGSWVGAQFGWDVSGAGDFNGDGYNDTIVGAPGNDSDRGAVYIFYGGDLMGGIINSIDANVTIDGKSIGDRFGSSVSDLGDVSKETPVDHVVISEVYADAVDETAPEVGEFMELYNPTATPVLLDNWVIEDLDAHSFTISGTIPAYGFFVIAINNYQASTDPTEASWPVPDFDCGYGSGTIFANGGDEVRIKDENGNIVDTFGYGVVAEWYEGAYHPTITAQGESYERKLGETQPNGGNGIDTNDNADDFSIRSSPEPQNTASASEVPPIQSFYDDVIVGAYGYGNDKGRVYVFFGSSGMPNNASDADVILTGETDNDLFGMAVSGAGDVNSDGFDDILVGAPGYDNNRGRSYIYNGAQNMKGWTQDIIFAQWAESDGAVYDPAYVYAIFEKRWLAQSFTPDKDYLLTKLWLYLDNIGTTTISISLEGHNNGPDGNILASADPKPSNPANPMPLTWVEFEFTTPFQATAGTMYWINARATGKNTNNCWGWLQDLDSNPNYTGGYSAFLINPPGVWTEEPDYDYWFKALGRLPSEILPEVTLTGGAQGDLFGWSVSDAGDIGWDGFDDVIVGAPGTANGNAYLINGSTAMKDVTVAGIGWGEEKQFANWETGGDMEPAVYTGQFVAQSFIPQDTYLQTNVSLLIKTFGTQGTLTIKLMGSTGSSPDTVPDGIVLAQAPSISTGNVSYEWTDFEWLVPYTGTIGTEYFIVAEGTGADTANCWGWYGQRTGSYSDGDSAYDPGSGWTAYDADFYFRAFGSSETALPNITFQGESPGDLFGYSVSSAGNFNGDAYDDIVVGAPGNGNGKVYIFNCSNILPSIIQAVNANYTALGEGPIDRFGWSVSMARDVNTTVGNYEVIVGAPFQDPGGLGDAGKAYILSTASTPPPPPVVDLPLRINNDAEFAALAASEGWVGDGSAGNPYIIEDYNIDGGGYGYCIYIGNTTVSFVIRDSNLYNSSGNAGNYFWDSGIALYNAPNGTLTNNIFENCTGNAVHIVGTTNTTISQNTILNSTGSGVYMESSTGNTIDDNTFDNNNYGLEMNTNSNSNTITNNSFTNNSEAMDLWASDNNIISDNFGDGNGMFAYLFSSCNGNEFLNNTISNSGTGIYLMSNCDGNTIQNNTITNMTWEGILIESSDSNVIEDNNIQRCRDGIYTILAVLNIISNNTLSNNTDNGIYLDPSSDQNTISNNSIADNGEFGILMISADFNIIIYNDIYNNTLYAINATSTTNENEIHHNNFTNNNGGDVQANDDGTDNWWNDTIGEGNLWGDYETRYVPPATSNGVVWDIPYDINGSAGAHDLYPLALYPWQKDLRIDNNTDFTETASFYGWAGDGSAGNPYIIEGLTIDAGGLGYGIYIGNTTVNFIIRNCSIENSTGNSDQYFRNSGIYLFNATNGTIDNNDIKSCDQNGINIEYSYDIVVTNNTVRYNKWSGIYTGYYSNITIENNICNNNSWSGVYIWSTWDSFVSNNTCLGNEDGITIEWTNNISIIDNICINNTKDGIYVMSSEYNTLLNNTCFYNEDGFYLDQSNNITLSGNDCNNNSDDGITVIRSEDISLYNNTCVDNEDGLYISASENNTLINNICINNSDDGISLNNADHNTITNNTSIYNSDGIGLNNSHNNTIANNICDNNSDGIDMDLSNYNTLFNNTCNYNTGDGFDINQSSNNTLDNNDCNNNIDNGIELSYYSNNNTIRNNTITGNANDGIFMDMMNSGGLIENNTISENGKNGITLTYDSDNFVIIYNIISNNSDYGILILDNDCENSIIHHNGFYNNNGSGVQAYDNGSNAWDDGYPSGGNFWSDYIGVDFNSTASQDVPPPDGFGDTPYDINGLKGAQDRYPLITFPWSPPPPSGLPEISNVTALPDPQETGGFVNISCNVTDSDGVSEVWVNVTLPTGGFINTSMNKGTGDSWFYNSPYSILGPHNYVIWAKDVAGIWNDSSGHSFTIQDTTPPMISNVQNLPDPQEAGGFVNVSCDVTDNVGVYGVWMNITLPGGGYTNLSMTKGLGDEWYNITVYATLGIYDYIIWTNDTSGNWNNSPGHSFTIQDTNSPEISNVGALPNSQEIGGNINITCDVTDSVGVTGVWVNISQPDGSNINVSMMKGTGNEWNNNTVYTILGIYDYVIWANDTSGNWNSSSGHSFTIQDNTLPVISNVFADPDPQEYGGSVNISCDVVDNMGIYNVWVNITLPGGGYNNISMRNGTGNLWYFDNTYTVLGSYDYVIWTNDTSGNWNLSTGHSFMVNPGVPFEIIIISGDGQSGSVALELAAPFVVEVRDQYGNPIPNTNVWFNVTLGGGSLDNTNPVLTGSNGRAQANLTLGTMVGLNTVTAEIAGGGITQVVFTATGIPGTPYDIVIISGNDQNGTVATKLTAPFIVEVQDRYGNPVPNTNVWFNVTLGVGTLDITNPIVTDSNGRTQANLTLGTLAGKNTVTAEISGGGITQVIFEANGTSGAPNDIMIISGNGQSGTVGTQLPEPFVVKITDQYGNPVSNAVVWLNITNGNGSLDTSNPLLTEDNGRTQTNLTLGANPGSNTIFAEIFGGGTTQVIFTATGISNKPEIISEVSNIELLEDNPPYTLNLFASAIDDEDLPQDLRWFITNIDNSLYTVSGQGTNTLVITPKADMHGNDYVTLLVGDSDGLEDSQPLWINITPVNDKPFFFPEPPDLTITKEVSYTFNYAPYILDIDDSIGDLTITTDDPDHTSVSGHLVTYLYPSSMVDQHVFVTLTLSDGVDSTSAVIQINITEDNVPVLRQELPDVMLYEGEIKYNVFDLDDFFYDPDGDAVYFSYGYSHINIIINQNHSVDFYAEGDWFGEEAVTFRARDPSSAIVEDTILVRVLPVNDPPMISGVPDLVVHYDAQYFFDLTPYIIDTDNTSTELRLSFMESLNDIWLISQNINVSLDNNLKLVVNYSDLYLDTTFQVKIIVFDGIDFAWDLINITVSENWQPELKKEMPDVVFYEDEYISDHLNVHDYFTDKDGDTLFFTYGQEHIQVVIHENGSVDFYADENWWGSENITIRATDTSGALVEDIITVTVLPVNDPPIITRIPDQEGVIGVTWVLDISPYIHDNDNNITELEIICESPYVTVVGMVLVFQYPSEIKEDTVQVLVCDPIYTNATTTFNVTLEEARVTGMDEFDIFQLILYLILVIVILVTILLLYIYHKGKYEVEEVLLVYRKRGLLISYKHKSDKIKVDRDLMTGMFTAIQDFVSDVFESDDKVTGTPLKVMELGDKKVMIEHGKYTYLAAVFKGGTWRLVTKLRTTLSDLEDKYDHILEEWDGNIGSFEGIDTFLEDLVTSD